MNLTLEVVLIASVAWLSGLALGHRNLVVAIVCLGWTVGALVVIHWTTGACR